jgi:DNA-3-methyladenine glycosylase I
MVNRCEWANGSELMQHYHDHEWCSPLHDNHMLFEFLILEGAQAGLSWSTILNKRENYRQAFWGFDPAVIAQYGEADIARLLANAGIVRNRLKISSTINNAQRYLNVEQEFGSFDHYIWQFVDGRPMRNSFTTLSQIPPRTEQSDAMSKDLRKRGFNFVGSTICYAFMQATGMVNDHLITCFRHEEVYALDRD